MNTVPVECGNVTLTLYELPEITLWIFAWPPVLRALHSSCVVSTISPLVLGATIVEERSKSWPLR